MATVTRAPRQTYQAAESIAQNLRVKLDADGRVSIAAGTESDIGIAAREAFSENEHFAVDLVTLEGTAIFTASEAITAGDEIYGANLGKVGKNDANVPIGIALESAAIDKTFEVLRRQL